MYKITETELKEIQKFLKEVQNLNVDTVEKNSKKFLYIKLKARKLYQKIDDNYLKIPK